MESSTQSILIKGLTTAKINNNLTYNDESSYFFISTQISPTLSDPQPVLTKNCSVASPHRDTSTRRCYGGNASLGKSAKAKKGIETCIFGTERGILAVFPKK